MPGRASVDANQIRLSRGMRRGLTAPVRRAFRSTKSKKPKSKKAAALRHGLATIPEAGHARLTSVYRSRMILAIDAR
jgi:hypothetical protein